MIDAIGRANMDYMVRLANDPAWAQRELETINQYCADHGAMYGGKPVPVPIKPHFISGAQRKLTQQAVSRLHSVLEKFIELWLEDEQLQREWGVSDEEMVLYKADPGFKPAIGISRFDAFLKDMDLKFLEFNCDSPGGTGYADIIHAGFTEMFDRNEMGTEYTVSNRARLLHLGQTIQAAYQQWREGRPDRPDSPFVVVSDWRDVGTIPDIDITIEHLRAEGLDAEFADPRDFTVKDDGLYLGDKRVDVVYKRVIVKELVADETTSALRKAYLDGNLCMINPPRSVIVGNKKILAGIRNPKLRARLNSLERQAIRDFVPWTEILREDKVDFHDFKVNLRDFVLDNKDQLVLKAAQSYGGKDVFLGFETSDEDWAALVEKHIHGNAWIVQALVPIPKELFPVVKNGEVTMDLMNVNINPLVFGGTYAGSYTRLSKKNVINVSFGGGMTAAMTIEPRGDDTE